MEISNLNKSLVTVVLSILLSCSKGVDGEVQSNRDFSVLNYGPQSPIEENLDSDRQEGFTGSYKTENVIILVIDGPRFSETWGDPKHENIPMLSKNLCKKGVVNSEFYNLGPTYTSAGHTAITTGNYQHIKNGGSELPKFPSIFQHWQKKNNTESAVSFIIASKDKLEVLSDTKHSEWKGKFKPGTDCGVNGLFSGYRSDDITYENTFEILSKERPKLVLINLKDPDFYGHKNKWEEYLSAIQRSDAFMGRLWSFLEDDPYYAGKTTLFMTNDNGRHLDAVKNGFIQHGDSCMGCRHINFFAIGPDFKRNHVFENPRNQVDISVTVAELLNFEMPYSEGSIMWELFK